MRQQRPYHFRIADLYKRKRIDFGKFLLIILNRAPGVLEKVLVDVLGLPQMRYLPPDDIPYDDFCKSVDERIAVYTDIDHAEGLLRRIADGYLRGEVTVARGDSPDPILRVPGFTTEDIQQLSAAYYQGVYGVLFIGATTSDSDLGKDTRPFQDDDWYNPDLVDAGLLDIEAEPGQCLDLVVKTPQSSFSTDGLDQSTNMGYHIVSDALEDLFEIIVRPDLDLGRCEGLRPEPEPRPAGGWETWLERAETARRANAPLIPCRRWFIKTGRSKHRRFCDNACNMRLRRAEGRG